MHKKILLSNKDSSNIYNNWNNLDQHRTNTFTTYTDNNNFWTNIGFDSAAPSGSRLGQCLPGIYTLYNTLYNNSGTTIGTYFAFAAKTTTIYPQNTGVHACVGRCNAKVNDMTLFKNMYYIEYLPYTSNDAERPGNFETYFFTEVPKYIANVTYRIDSSWVQYYTFTKLEKVTYPNLITSADLQLDPNAYTKIFWTDQEYPLNTEIKSSEVKTSDKLTLCPNFVTLASNTSYTITLDFSIDYSC